MTAGREYELTEPMRKLPAYFRGRMPYEKEKSQIVGAIAGTIASDICLGRLRKERNYHHRGNGGSGDSHNPSPQYECESAAGGTCGKYDIYQSGTVLDGTGGS
jgi:hypothetical protein